MSSIIQESWLTLAYWESWYIFDVTFFKWTMVYIRWSILFRVLCKYKMYRLLMHSKLKHIQNSRHSRYFESYVYSSPSILRTRGIWWAVFYRTLCDTGIFRTQGIFQTLSNIYYGEFYSESCVTLAYLKPWHIQNQNTVSRISIFIILSNIYHEIFYLNSCVTLTYLEPYYIHHSGMLLKTSIFRTLPNI